jgi:hypothetical protein
MFFQNVYTHGSLRCAQTPCKLRTIRRALWALTGLENEVARCNKIESNFHMSKGVAPPNFMFALDTELCLWRAESSNESLCGARFSCRVGGTLCAWCRICLQAWHHVIVITKSVSTLASNTCRSLNPFSHAHGTSRIHPYPHPPDSAPTIAISRSILFSGWPCRVGRHARRITIAAFLLRATRSG